MNYEKFHFYRFFTSNLQIFGQSGVAVNISGSSADNSAMPDVQSTSKPGNAGGISSSSDITITSSAGFVSITAGGSEIKIYSSGQIDIDSDISLNKTSSSNLGISSNDILSLSVGAARVNDLVTPPFIISGSSSVKIGN